MSPVAVVCDSAADLPTDAGVLIVPLTVVFGTEELRDGVDLPAPEFWERVARDPSLPTTASPPPEVFARSYRAAADAGAVGVVSIHLSGALSRTVESARQAAGESPVPVEVVDSRSVSLGEGLVALAAARPAADGASLREVAEEARSAASRVEVIAFLDTVDFLRRGGRVGRAKAALSDLLRIRPILTLENGEPTLAARARTRERALAEVLARCEGGADAAGVLHSGAPECDRVAAALAASCGVTPLVALIGAVTGTHLGPHALGVALLRPVSTLTR